MICPVEEHARNKEIDLMTKRGQLNILLIYVFLSLIYIDKRNQSQKVIFTFKSRRTQQRPLQYLHHSSTEKAEQSSEWSKGSKQYCAIVNFDSDVPCKRY